MNVIAVQHVNQYALIRGQYSIRPKSFKTQLATFG